MGHTWGPLALDLAGLDVKGVVVEGADDAAVDDLLADDLALQGQAEVGALVADRIHLPCTQPAAVGAFRAVSGCVCSCRGAHATGVWVGARRRGAPMVEAPGPGRLAAGGLSRDQPVLALH